MRYATMTLTVALLVLAGCADDDYDTEETEPTTDVGVEDTELGVDEEPMTVELDWGAYGDWDADANAEISAAEFETGFRDLGLYEDWDVDASGDLTSDELVAGYWTTWDTDGDGFVDEAEWSAATDAWRFQDVDYGAYADWDVDGDGLVGEDEYAQWFNDNAWESWDTDGDGVLGPDEAGDIFFDLFDGNDDDLIDEAEWNATVETFETDTGEMSAEAI